MKWPSPRRSLQVLALALLVLIVVVGGVAALLVKAAPGHRFVLRTAVSVLDRQLEGSLTVDGIQSASLLRGLTLMGISIQDPEGQPLLTADSVRVGYDLRSLVARRGLLEPLEVWSPAFHLETRPGETRTNLQRIFQLDGPAPEEERVQEAQPAPGRFNLRLGRVRVHDGTLTLTPPDASPLIVRDIQARLDEVVLLDPGTPGERVVVRELALQVFLLDADEPLRIEDVQGEIRRTGTRLDMALDRLSLPQTTLDGRLGLDWGGDVLELFIDAEATAFHTADFLWLEPRLPSVGGRFLVLGEGPLTTGVWRIDGLDLEGDGLRLAGRGGLRLPSGDDPLILLDSEVEGVLPLALLEPWLEAPPPVGGRVEGTLALAGRLSALDLDGTLTWDDPVAGTPPSTLRIQGRADLPGQRVQRFTVALDPLRLGTLAPLGFDGSGTGSLRLMADGGLQTGLDLSLDVRHRVLGEEIDGSRIFMVGSLRAPGSRLPLTSIDDLRLDALQVDLEVDLAPLHIDGLAAALRQESFPLRGAVTGDFRVVGPLADLEFWGALGGDGGEVRAEGTLNALDPASQYTLEAVTDGMALAWLLPQVPDDAYLEMSLEAQGGGGLDLEVLQSRFRVALERGVWRGLEVNTGVLQGAVESGQLRVEQFRVEGAGTRLVGFGDLPLTEQTEAPGLLQLRADLVDLAALRSLLSWPIETPLGGEAEAQIQVRGYWPELEGTLRANGSALQVGVAEVRGLRFEAEAALRPEDGGRMPGLESFDARLAVEAPSWDRWAFEDVSAQVSGNLRDLGVRLALDRAPGEAYRLAGRLELEEARGQLALDTLDLLLDPVRWTLEAPALVAWEGRRFAIESLSLGRPDPVRPVRMALVGSADLDGLLDLSVEFERVDLFRIARLAQLDLEPSGLVDLSLVIGGEAAHPEIDGTLTLSDLIVGPTEISRVEAVLGARDRRAQVSVDLTLEGVERATFEGSYPIDLALEPLGPRVPENEPVSLRLDVFRLPAATLLSPLEVLEDVAGWIDGEIRVDGTPADLRPSGVLRIRDGGFALADLGIAPDQLEGQFTLLPDRRIQIDARARSVGEVFLRGEVNLADLADPTFDLEMTAQGLQAVDRRDLEGRVTGTVRLMGQYTAPRVTGGIRVDQANLFLEEFVRTAEVVDLSDPAFLEAVDTTLVAARSVLQAAQNPFVENLRVDANLAMPRDVWLRSREMNVEIGGNLVMAFDRRDREIVLVGTVGALRGSYNAFGRTFQVRSGVVDFQGTPGINPNLSIEAVHRLRQQGGEPLDIVARLEGTLLAPRISLTSDGTVSIAESDLISYLLFGRPSYALASAETRILGDAAVSAGIGAAAGQLSSILGQQIGLDYFAITQAQDAGPGLGALSSAGLVDTQVELGQYLTDNLFLALSLRPLRGIGGSQAQIPGARVEWQLTDAWTFNAFLEDRFGRQGGASFVDQGLRINRVFGLEIFREWGY